jgi:hypothetical protein
MDIIYIAIAALGGSLISGLIGWLKSDQPWNTKKYVESILSGIGAAAVLAMAYQFSEGGLKIYDLLAALAGGMGVDNAVNRISGIISKG